MANSNEKKFNIEIVNVDLKELRKRGYRDLKHWQFHRVLYIGPVCTIPYFVKSANGSKWDNPFKAKRYGVEKSLELYEQQIRRIPEHWNALEELIYYKELGCCCQDTQACHGQVLLKLLEEKLNEQLQ